MSIWDASPIVLMLLTWGVAYSVYARTENEKTTMARGSQAQSDDLNRAALMLAAKEDVQSLEVGSRWIGTLGFAQKRGLEPDTPRHDMYVAAFTEYLEQTRGGVLAGRDGIITGFQTCIGAMEGNGEMYKEIHWRNARIHGTYQNF